MISIIIPAYNAEDFIERCLKSIFNQSNQDYEIIVVNDGSSDNTLAILERLKDEHPDYAFTIITTPNRGHGPARNLGVSQATGDYIWFIDADDYLYSDDAIDGCICDLNNNNPDIYIFSAFETDFKKRKKYWHYARKEKLTNIKKDPTLYFKQNWSWNKILKKSFLDTTGLCYNDCMMFEDVYLYVDLYQQAKSIYISRDVKYVYVKHNKSLTSSLKNFKGYPQALWYEFKAFIKTIFS